MDVQQAIKQRRSVRDYKPEQISEEKLGKVLAAARLAPSAHNSQDWKFVVVRNPEKRRALAVAANSQSFIATASVVVAAVALDPHHIMSCEVPSYAVNLAIAVDHMTLQAAEEGLGTCWIGAFNQGEVKRILNIPEEYKVVALMPLGVPADQPREKLRKSFEEIVCFEEFA